MAAWLERFREDRLVRWGVYASAPFLWLALALFNPFLLVVPPIMIFALRKAFAYGIFERYEAPPDPDLL
jgi:hypothetical protein